MSHWISSICDILCVSTVITERRQATPRHSPATVCLLCRFFSFPPPAALMYQTLTRGTELAPIQPIVNEADDILMANEPLLKDKLSSGKQTALSFFLALSPSIPPSCTLTHARTRGLAIHCVQKSRYPHLAVETKMKMRGESCKNTSIVWRWGPRAVIDSDSERGSRILRDVRNAAWTGVSDETQRGRGHIITVKPEAFFWLFF